MFAPRASNVGLPSSLPPRLGLRVAWPGFPRPAPDFTEMALLPRRAGTDAGRLAPDRPPRLRDQRRRDGKETDSRPTCSGHQGHAEMPPGG